MISVSRQEKTQSPISYQALHDYCNGDKELIGKLLEAFAAAEASYLAEARIALASRNVESIRALCHKIRGAAMIIHAEQLLKVVAKIRKMAIEQRFDPAQSLMPLLEKRMHEVIEEIGRVKKLL